MKSKVQIRQARAEDALGIIEIYKPFIEKTAVSFEVEVPSESEMQSRIKALAPRYPWLVCVIDETIAGYAYAGLHRSRTSYQWSTEVSVYLHEGFRGKRIGSALYASLLDILTAQGFKNALAGMTLPNPASERFHKSIGFETIATYPDVGYKFGKWHATQWMVLPLHEPDQAPKTLIDSKALEGTALWNTAIDKGCAIINQALEHA